MITILMVQKQEVRAILHLPVLEAGSTAVTLSCDHGVLMPSKTVECQDCLWLEHHRGMKFADMERRAR